MNEKTTQAVNIGTEIVKEAMSSPKTVTVLSGYILGVHWLDLLSEAFKYGSTALAFLALCLVTNNHFLTRKKSKSYSKTK